MNNYKERRRTEQLQRSHHLVKVQCPFCLKEMSALIWHLCGRGRVCPCGALLQLQSSERRDSVAP